MPEYAECAPAAQVYSANSNGNNKMNNPASENNLREQVKRRIRRMLKIDTLSLHNGSTPAEFITVLDFPG